MESSKTTGKKHNLEEITFIRPILIILLVLYHSFAIYSGAWHEPDKMVYYSSYRWIALFSNSFFIESFVFISGYLMAFQMLSSDKTITYKTLIKKKLQRLILPSLVFSSIYVLLYKEGGICLGNFPSILEGAGHLWFLPMLFWCFVIGYPLVTVWSFKPVKLLIVLALCTFFSVFQLPLRLSTALNYLFFFVGGYYCFLYRNRIYDALNKHCFLLWLFFICLFFLFNIILDQLQIRLSTREDKFLVDTLISGISHSFKFLYSSLGVIALWILSLRITRFVSPPNWYKEFGNYCMGVYVFQQFILVYIVYYSSIPEAVGFLWLPWLSFLIALGSSVLLSYSVKRL